MTGTYQLRCRECGRTFDNQPRSICECFSPLDAVGCLCGERKPRPGRCSSFSPRSVRRFARVWPVARRYRVLLALRRGEYGQAIHGLLGPVDELLADLVKRGQDSDVFAQHLPAGILSQVAYGVVFAIADSDLSNGTLGARAATITSLLMLGVPETRAIALVGDQP